MKNVHNLAEIHDEDVEFKDGEDNYDPVERIVIESAANGWFITVDRESGESEKMIFDDYKLVLEYLKDKG